VDRDDLKDGGASAFAETVRWVRELTPGCSVEVLIPDFRGSKEALKQILSVKPDILNHNTETVPRLYRKARPGGSYLRTLEILSLAGESGIVTKSGLMVGLGETDEELINAMEDLRSVGCTILTLGQYLRPSEKHLAVARYYLPEEFLRLKQIGDGMGFGLVESGPLVRSSYHARSQIQNVKRSL
jgi:lipoic acid synthetase